MAKLMRRLCCLASGVAASIVHFLLRSTYGFVSERMTAMPPSPRPSLSLSSSYDPNDGESVEERRARMELVRRIQANFYWPGKTGTGSDDGRTEDHHDDGRSRWLVRDPGDASSMRNVPLWRVQWTEFPGYQNVLNVHVAHYTHMFRRLLLEHPRPWFFGHVFLPGGSENLGNPDFFLPEEEGSDPNQGDSLAEKGGKERSGGGDVPVVGTLMQITDYSEREDGRMTLIVQGVGRIKILAVSQQVPYAIASRVQILSDEESWQQHCSGLVGSAPNDFDLSVAYIDAARAVAAMESELLRDFEYYRTSMEQNTSPDGTVTISGVSPLSNVNGSVTVDFNGVNTRLQETFTGHLSQRAEECGRDDVLLASTTARLADTRASPDVHTKEREVWIKLDEMIHLLGRAQPGVRIPVPAQMLGLLPAGADWPEGFRLREYVERLEGDGGTRVGTYSRSPFVRLSKACPQYPPIRRASRLSYVVWILVDGMAGLAGEAFDREKYLGTSRVTDRLEYTVQYLELINKAIEGTIGT